MAAKVRQQRHKFPLEMKSHIHIAGAFGPLHFWKHTITAHKSCCNPYVLLDVNAISPWTLKLADSVMLTSQPCIVISLEPGKHTVDDHQALWSTIFLAYSGFGVLLLLIKANKRACSANISPYELWRRRKREANKDRRILLWQIGFGALAGVWLLFAPT
jgi:hypothetical protein